MKKKGLVLVVLFFAVLILSPLVHSKDDSSKEVQLTDDEKAFIDSFKWKRPGVKKLAIHALRIIPEWHKAIGMESLKAALKKNVEKAPDEIVTGELFSATLWEVAPPEVQARAFQLLTEGK